ncbi:MAG: hypothetical protein Ct9H300mP11_05020 [Chloroflexota bacterium]|nr:MAG: hypothetical protein Ct9H300mP11_05020 [Chloroflexota bacterium]
MGSLQGHNSISKVGLTGSPFTRKAQLSASTRTLYTSLPIALVAAALPFYIDYAIYQVCRNHSDPIILVVAWLYGIMYISGFALNLLRV